MNTECGFSTRSASISHILFAPIETIWPWFPTESKRFCRFFSPCHLTTTSFAGCLLDRTSSCSVDQSAKRTRDRQMPSLASTNVAFEVLRRSAECSCAIGGATSVKSSTAEPRTGSRTSACQFAPVPTSAAIGDCVQLKNAFRHRREHSLLIEQTRAMCSSMACGLNHARFLQCLPRHDEEFEKEKPADKPESTKHDLSQSTLPFWRRREAEKQDRVHTNQAQDG